MQVTRKCRPRENIPLGLDIAVKICYFRGYNCLFDDYDDDDECIFTLLISAFCRYSEEYWRDVLRESARKISASDLVSRKQLLTPLKDMKSSIELSFHIYQAQ